MMICIDGSYGEGGGQILRSSLALSLVTGEPFRIENIRAARRKPGLIRQHLTAVNAAAQVGRAHVSGDHIGSMSVSFAPRTVKSGNYRFAVETAGSATLVLQTILPALLCADSNSQIILEGGTHNPFAPPFDFLKTVFAPLIDRMGPKLLLSLDRYGFYPAGGGRFTVSLDPCRKLEPIKLLERGATVRRLARAIVARLPIHICERELRTFANRLSWPEGLLRAESVEDSAGPGNVFVVEIESEHITEVFTGFGQKGIPAHAVAAEVADRVRDYLAADAPVGRHLADQLMIPMALAGGGRYKTLPLTRHSTTNIEIIGRFLDVKLTVTQVGHNVCEVGIEGP